MQEAAADMTPEEAARRLCARADDCTGSLEQAATTAHRRASHAAPHILKASPRTAMPHAIHATPFVVSSSPRPRGHADDCRRWCSSSHQPSCFPSSTTTSTSAGGVSGSRGSSSYLRGRAAVGAHTQRDSEDGKARTLQAEVARRWACSCRARQTPISAGLVRQGEGANAG